MKEFMTENDFYLVCNGLNRKLNRVVPKPSYNFKRHYLKTVSELEKNEREFWITFIKTNLRYLLSDGSAKGIFGMSAAISKYKFNQIKNEIENNLKLFNIVVVKEDDLSETAEKVTSDDNTQDLALIKLAKDKGIALDNLKTLYNLKTAKTKFKGQSEATILNKVIESCNKNDIPEDLTFTIFQTVIEYVRTGKCKPILLTGNPGIGKTYLAKVISEVLDLGFFKISASGAATGFGLTGDCKNYKGARYGEIANAQVQTKSANPVILIDEIDKATTNTTGSTHNITDELLPCLDNTRSLRDNFLEKEIDTSGIIFVLTANNPYCISPWLKDRCRVNLFPNPDFDRIFSISLKMFNKINSNTLYDGRLKLNKRDLSDIVHIMIEDGIISLRKYEDLLECAASHALIQLIKERKETIEVDRNFLLDSYIENSDITISVE